MSRASSLKLKYGLTEADYDFILQKQGGCCAICRRPQEQFRTRLCVDHEHTPEGPVRGLLCQTCNRFVVGRLRGPEGVRLLHNASEYLKGPYPGWFVPAKKKRKKRAKVKRRGKGAKS